MNVNAAAVLLLNAGYTPIRVITVRAAVDLMMRGVVESVEGVSARLRTPSRVFEVPSILRLRYYVNVPQRGAIWSRRNVMKRDNYTCIYCGARPGNVAQHGRHKHELGKPDFTIDHIIPRARGGASNWVNTACACHGCNQKKRDRTAHEAGMKLLWEPKRPRTNYLIASGDVPKEWKVYLQV